MGITYSQSGVDVRSVRAIQERINQRILSTQNAHTPHMLAGHYAGVFEAGGQKLTIHCDGVGSKILVAAAMGKHDTVGIDAVAMNANDIVCVGSTPIVGVDYLALSRPDEELIAQVMEGLVAGCQEAGVALVGGETAILPDMIKGDESPEGGAGARGGASAKTAGAPRGGRYADYDLAMTVVGTLRGEPLTGSAMKAGDVLVGLDSSGLHSNGYSLARKLLPIQEWGEEMLAPTRVYVKPVLEMVAAGHAHGLAHITGGAFSKLSRIGAHAGVGFELDAMPPCEKGGMWAELAGQVKEPRELYRTFNMGVGMVVACAPDRAEGVMRIARKHKVEASVVGKAVAGQDVVLAQGGKRVSLL